MVKKRKYTRFRPKEKTYNYDDYFGAKTNSERNLNLSGSNDRPVNEYIKNNRTSLLNRARKNPKSVIVDINSRGTWSKGEIDPSSVRKGFLLKFLGDKSWWNE